MYVCKERIKKTGCGFYSGMIHRKKKWIMSYNEIFIIEPSTCLLSHQSLLILIHGVITVSCNWEEVLYKSCCPIGRIPTTALSSKYKIEHRRKAPAAWRERRKGESPKIRRFDCRVSIC
jgi:hypothetical protein